MTNEQKQQIEKLSKELREEQKKFQDKKQAEKDKNNQNTNR